MSRVVELSDEDYARLERAAEVEGILPAEWISRCIPRWPDPQPLLGADGRPARTMADVLAGRIGTLSGSAGQPSSDHIRESFGEYLEQKQRERRL